MSDVKQRIINIVMGRPQPEPQNLVDVKPNQVVVTIPASTTWYENEGKELFLPTGERRLNLAPFTKLENKDVHESDPTGYIAESEPKPFIRFGMSLSCDILPRGVTFDQAVEYLDACGLESPPRVAK